MSTPHDQVQSIADCASQAVLVGLLWGVAYGVLGAEIAAPPNGLLFSYIVLLVFAGIFGRLAKMIGLPQLTGKS